MCQRIGRPPISTIGLGRNSVSSRRRVPNPPARITAFMATPFELDNAYISRPNGFVAKKRLFLSIFTSLYSLTRRF